MLNGESMPIEAHFKVLKRSNTINDFWCCYLRTVEPVCSLGNGSKLNENVFVHHASGFDGKSCLLSGYGILIRDGSNPSIYILRRLRLRLAGEASQTSTFDGPLL